MTYKPPRLNGLDGRSQVGQKWSIKNGAPGFYLTFIGQKANVILLGPPGLGKTYLAVSLALKACQAGRSIYFKQLNECAQILDDR